MGITATEPTGRLVSTLEDWLDLYCTIPHLTFHDIASAVASHLQTVGYADDGRPLFVMQEAEPGGGRDRPDNERSGGQEGPHVVNVSVPAGAPGDAVARRNGELARHVWARARTGFAVDAQRFSFLQRALRRNGHEIAAPGQVWDALRLCDERQLQELLEEIETYAKALHR